MIARPARFRAFVCLVMDATTTRKNKIQLELRGSVKRDLELVSVNSVISQCHKNLLTNLHSQLDTVSGLMCYSNIDAENIVNHRVI